MGDGGSDEYKEEGFFIVVLDDGPVQVPRFCPHRGGRLYHGQVNLKYKTVTCPLHKSRFSLENGEQLGGPPCGKLDVMKCQEHADELEHAGEG